MTNAYKIMFGKSEEKKPFGKARRRWKNNIKTDLSEMGFEGVNRIQVAQDRDS
jgi:hypothetical protein